MEDIAPVTAVGMAAQTTPVAGESSSSTQFSSPIADMNWLSFTSSRAYNRLFNLFDSVLSKNRFKRWKAKKVLSSKKITVLESNLKKVMGGSYSEKG